MSKPEIEMKKVGPIYYKLGLVADPAPEVLFNKDFLARFKVQMIDHEIVEMKENIKFAESYKALIREQYKLG